jgi:hypothetical protein
MNKPIEFLVIETKHGEWQYAIYPGDNVYEKLKTYNVVLTPGTAMSYKYIKYIKYDKLRKKII